MNIVNSAYIETFKLYACTIIYIIRANQDRANHDKETYDDITGRWKRYLDIINQTAKW